MILAPVSQPPSVHQIPGESAKAIPALKDTNSHNIPVNIIPPTTPGERTASLADANEKHDDFLERLDVPTVVLDTPSISHTMAAALSLSLLGHTLFLKSQVPFPVAQLLRMPGGGSNPKVAKKREELLATFDMLSSHLQTTFVALSTAYARCEPAKSRTTASPTDENTHQDLQAGPGDAPQREATHLMFVLGPSAGAARARIILTIDGLEVKVWGQRPNAPSNETLYDDDTSINIEETDEEDDEEDSDEIENDDQSEDGADSLSADGSVATEDQEDELDELDSDVESSGPPSSRSPSPDPPDRSLAPSPESLSSPKPVIEPLPVLAGRAATSSSSSPTGVPFSARDNDRPPAALSSRGSSPQSVLSYAEEQAAVRAAERLLSRTLMNAWAENGPAGDMASELAPTQTHIYLRAPRRFAHPAWVARQNLARTLDGVLDAFLANAGAFRPNQGNGNGKKARGVRTEGAWIGCRGGSAFAAKRANRSAADIHPSSGVGETADGNEEDEEIWWAWEGKIVGFADW